MAEAVAATAAIIQFVDVAIRLSSHLGHLCSEVRNVPHLFARLQADLKQQLEVAQVLKSNFLPHFSATVVSTTFDESLLEYIALVGELCKTLEKILSRKDDRLLQRTWVGFCSMRKKDEMLQICTLLEQKKSVMSLWLSAAVL